jgi:O-antigen ligase
MEKSRYAWLIDIFIWFGDVLILVCTFIFVNISAFLGGQFPDVSLFDGEGWWWVPGSGVVVILMVVNLFVRKELKTFAHVWSRNYWLILFLFYSLASLLWTVYFSATIYELTLLFFSSFAAAYFAIRYRLSGSINLMTGIAMFCVVASFYIVFFTRGGVMQNVPFVGSWNGLFWHRNHTGSLMAFFSTIFLLRLIMDNGLFLLGKVVCSIFYVLSVVHVFGSRSAAGILVYMLLNMVVLLFYFWLRFREKLTMKHYYAFALAVMIGFIVFLSNTDFFFGLLGRNSSLTGRIPLWKDLFSNFYLAKPIFGYGYGALWMQESFRVLMQSRHNWPYPVYFADNGFFDILLNLGLVGFVLFLAMYLKAVFRNVRLIVNNQAWRPIILILILLYVFVGNLAYSFLLEVDHFVWMWLVVVVFLLQVSEDEVLPQVS